MKKRIVPILTATVALVLIAGLAYAAKKKEKESAVGHDPDPTHEEEALQAELLEATEEGSEKLPGVGAVRTKKVAQAQSQEKPRVHRAKKTEQAKDAL